MVQVLEECGEERTRGYNITGGRMCLLDGDLRATQPCVHAQPCAPVRHASRYVKSISFHLPLNTQCMNVSIVAGTPILLFLLIFSFSLSFFSFISLFSATCPRPFLLLSYFHLSSHPTSSHPISSHLHRAFIPAALIFSSFGMFVCLFVYL